jgi:hypothetical protein
MHMIDGGEHAWKLMASVRRTARRTVPPLFGEFHRSQLHYRLLAAELRYLKLWQRLAIGDRGNNDVPIEDPPPPPNTLLPSLNTTSMPSNTVDPTRPQPAAGTVSSPSEGGGMSAYAEVRARNILGPKVAAKKLRPDIMTPQAKMNLEDALRSVAQEYV